MSKFALVAFLAKTTLIVLADQMANSRALVGRSVVTIGTGRTQRAVTIFVSSARRAVMLVRKAKGWEGRLEEREEGQVGHGSAGRVEDLLRDGHDRVGRSSDDQVMRKQ